MVRKTIAFGFITLFVATSALTFKAGTTLAQFDCLTLTPNSSAQDKAYCQNELAQIEAQLADLLAKQKEQQKQTGTLKGDVDYLTSQINALKAKIKARSLAIAQLGVSIKEKASTIQTLGNKIEDQHESIAQLIRNTENFDNQDFLYVVLASGSLSNFYSDLESYNQVQEAVKEAVEETKGLKAETETEKKDLEKKKDAETDAKKELESAQKKVAQTEAEKKQLLAISKQKEGEYQRLANEKKARADRIRSALFSLAGISQKIEFGTALAYARTAQARTGVNPAFLLAILTQESNLGSNVGRCYLTATSGATAGWGVNITTGKTWTNLMKPTRDIAPFLEITQRLGLDPLRTAVSCPIAGVAGYGGAMGPAQFIPSTWKLFEDRLENMLGRFASPWVPEDAFMASALYLTDLGAVGNGYSSQIRAACKYYGSGGSTCSYGRSVMNFKSKIQADIDYLEQYGVTR